MPFAHQSVLLAEVMRQIVPHEPRTIVDCTLGGGGHAAALLEACPKARLVGLDRDAEAVAAARQALAPFAGRAQAIHAAFRDVAEVLARLGLDTVDALVADLGVSSHQLDARERGFSFAADAPLDMRMDRSAGPTAAQVIAAATEQELAEAIRDFGEERHARRVARAIKAAAPATTAELADAVRSVVRRSADGIDPATRTFQAIRILTNGELDELQRLLGELPSLLSDGGVAVMISFHSLEDRAVKRAFADAARDCVCPPGMPVCACGRVPSLEILTRKPIRPRDDEVALNPRARSAKLRAARRLPR
jgi:16S rRNA (cytosine1402-N4)-methyltransferase